MFDTKIIHPNGSWLMSEAPVPQDPGRDENPPGVPAGSGADHPEFGSPDWQLIPSTPEWPEWMDEPGYLAALSEDDPGDGEPEEYQDPDNAPPPGMDDAQLAALIAEAREFTADQAEAEAEMAGAGQAGIRAALGSVAAAAGARGCPAPRRGSPVSTPAGPPGSPPASRWTSRPAARCWPNSPARPPGTMTGTAARRMMSWSESSARGTGSRPTPVPASMPRWRSCSAAVRARRCRGRRVWVAGGVG